MGKKMPQNQTEINIQTNKLLEEENRYYSKVLKLIKYKIFSHTSSVTIPDPRS